MTLPIYLELVNRTFRAEIQRCSFHSIGPQCVLLGVLVHHISCHRFHFIIAIFRPLLVGASGLDRLEKTYGHFALFSNTCSLVHVNPVTPSGARALIGLSRRTVGLVASDYGSLVCGDGLGVTPHFPYERGREQSLSRYIAMYSLREKALYSPPHTILSRNTFSFPQRIQSKTSLFHCTNKIWLTLSISNQNGLEMQRLQYRQRVYCQ
ncbi:hypothetical protein GMDG_00884 [Pseudogymnoascus destructans 20631-21]|uniref:Uncharacterized protein n=1 Tax=Pseudogymnoascus destructans (strain ATCC MYA-4855 / 20631-21) TaxID=658429 RepID=L8FML1_PSED2|nr:hypothetical protein GMDG_00884 [Pseudogymnoascus destructans 20631-21]